MVENLTLSSRARRSDKTAWSPTDRDLRLYCDWASGIPVESIASAARIAKRTAHERISKVSNWIRQELIDDAAELRIQHTTLLMRHYRELKVLWDAATVAMPGKARRRGTKPKPGEACGTKAGDPIRLDRPIQIIKEMRNTLESIGTLNGLRATAGDHGDNGDEERVAGMRRSSVIMREITKLTVQLDREREIEGGLSGGENDRIRDVPAEGG